ncbi:MAG: GIY-YIG nuclease family protein [archaeon]|nr:GIY-YIG nuclease family protein [archaeon]
MFFQYIYILKCNRNGESTFYTGMTNNPKRRYNEHKRCRCKYTKRFNGNVYMVYLEVLEHRDKKTVNSMAWKREKQVKKYSKKKKNQIIRLNQEKASILIKKHLG